MYQVWQAANRVRFAGAAHSQHGCIHYAVLGVALADWGAAASWRVISARYGIETEIRYWIMMLGNMLLTKYILIQIPLEHLRFVILWDQKRRTEIEILRILCRQAN